MGVAAQTFDSRLMTPSAKISARLLRSAIKQVAEKTNSDYLELEHRYSNTQSALAHLLAHDRYRSHIEDKVADLVRTTEHLLSLPGVAKLAKRKDWVERLAEAAKGLGDARLESLKATEVTVDDVRVFLEVVEANRQVHFNESYDPSHVISASVYALAEIMASNFEAYRLTLNT